MQPSVFYISWAFIVGSILSQCDTLLRFFICFMIYILHAQNNKTYFFYVLHADKTWFLTNQSMHRVLCIRYSLCSDWPAGFWLVLWWWVHHHHFAACGSQKHPYFIISIDKMANIALETYNYPGCLTEKHYLELYFSDYPSPAKTITVLFVKKHEFLWIVIPHRMLSNLLIWVV